MQPKARGARGLRNPNSMPETVKNWETSGLIGV